MLFSSRLENYSIGNCRPIDKYNIKYVKMYYIDEYKYIKTG